MRRVTSDSELSRRVAALIDPETGPSSAAQLAAMTGLSEQSIYNCRDGKSQKPGTLDTIRRAVESIESGDGVTPLPRRARESVRLQMGRGVWIVVENDADPAVLARILRMDEAERDERT